MQFGIPVSRLNLVAMIKPMEIGSIVPALAQNARAGHPQFGNMETETGMKGWATRVSYLSYTNQLRDFVAYAQQENLTFELTVRNGTKLSGPLQQAIAAGQITLKTFKP